MTQAGGDVTSQVTECEPVGGRGQKKKNEKSSLLVPLPFYSSLFMACLFAEEGTVARFVRKSS